MGLDVPEFKGSEIIDLFAYLRSQGQRQAAKDFRSAGDPVKGQSLFAAKACARCHAIFGKGPDVGPDLGKTELRGSVTQLAGRMWNHWAAMSEAMGAMGMATPSFHGEELADVFSYLFIARYEGQAGNLDRGRMVYRQKGCSGCHGTTGLGALGPALKKTKGETKEEIVQRMWNHAPQMYEKMGTNRVPWPRFTPDELADLLTLLTAGLDAPGGPHAATPAHH